MFTGIVEALGTVGSIQRKSQGATLEIWASEVLADAKIGHSIAVDGACLTIRSLAPEAFIADISAETLRRTTLGQRKAGEQVNLERSLRLNDRLGGHLVLGHVDEVATISGWKDEGNASLMQVTMSNNVKPYIAYKGSIAVDGVSLTIANLLADAFQVALIPHTKHVTTLGTKRNGAHVNIEVDLVARYVESLLSRATPATANRTNMVSGLQTSPTTPSERLDLRFLTEHGYTES